MKEISCINQKFSLKTVVSDDLTAIVMKSGDLPVLATPAMIALMELTSKEMIKDYLDDDETTVGININVSHLKASLVGDVIETVSELIGIDKRKLTFSVKAYCNDVLIGEGSHERFIVNEEKFMNKLIGEKNENK